MKSLLPVAIFFFLFFAVITVKAQKGSVHAKVLNENNKQAIDFATVSVINIADSAVIRNSVTDKAGMVNITGLKNGNYKLVISQLGLTTLAKPFTIAPGKTSVDLGDLTMSDKIHKLGEVDVVAEKAPVTIKKDTVEFNAGSYKTQKNDNVEELLKKLPGMDVDKDGKVTAQGKQVTKVLVEGKEFFGNDPKAATKNLPADAIDKVQLIDDKTDKAKNTGIDDGQRDKVINLKLKADKKSGWFGNITGEGGTDDRYLGQFNVNHFDNKKQLSFLFLSNNVNENGFSFEDLNNFTGGNVFDTFSSGSGNSISVNNNNGRLNINNAFSGVNGGLIKSTTGGINYSDEFGKKSQLKFNMNLLTLVTSNNIAQFSDLQDIPNSLFTKQNSVGNNVNNSYRLNMSFDYKVDTLTNIKFKPSISTTHKTNYSDLHSSTLGAQQDSVNSINQLFNQKNNSPAFGGQFTVNHKFTEGKGSINFYTYGNYSESNSNYTNQSLVKYYTNALAGTDANQQASQDNDASFLNSTFSYIRQLSKKHQLNLTLSENAELRKQIANQYTVDYNAVTGKYEFFDPLLSGNFNNSNWRYTTTAGLNKAGEKLTWNLNLAVADLGLQGDFTTNNQFNRVNRQQWAFVPNASLSYHQKNGENLYLNVSSDVTLPTANDLQPVFNNTNPLYIRQGNPDLLASRSVNISGNYGLFDFKNNTYINLYGNLTPSWHGFSTSSSVDANGITTSKPVNTDGNYSSNFGFNIGKPTKIKGLKFSLGLNGSFNRNVNFINANENAVLRVAPGASGSLTYDTDPMQLSIRTYDTYNNAKNSYQSIADQHYYTYNNTLSASFKQIKKWRIFSDINQNLYRGQPATANITYYIWNAGIEHYLLESQNLTFSLNAHDLLNQSSGIQRSITNTGIIQNIQTNTIGRYFYAKIIYKISKVGSKGNKQSGGIIIMN